MPRASLNRSLSSVPQRLKKLFGAKQKRASAAELWREYIKSPDTHPLIPNVSYAGYRMGNTEIPDRNGPIFHVEDFGAAPGSDCESDEAVTAALAAAEQAGGVVLFPEGTFYFSSVIWVHSSHVVIRGAGAGKTTLHFTKPLDTAYRQARSGEWSWTGGLVWFIPRQLRSDLELSEWKWGSNEGWTRNKKLASVTETIPRGSFTIPVSDVSALRPGSHVLLSLTNTPDHSLMNHFCGDLPHGSYDFADSASSLHRQSNYRTYRWPVQIDTVSENAIVLAQPTKTDLRLEWNPTVWSLGPHIAESGIEDITLRMQPAPQRPHNQDPGFNGPHFQAALNCWARRVEVIDSDNGFGLTSSKGITLCDVSVSGRSRHHSFICREQTHDCLTHQFSIAPPTTALPPKAQTHGLNVEGYSSGNVWSAGQMVGTFDSHRRIPFDAVRTEITVTNTGSIGGAKKAGPHWGARFVHWNVDVTNGRAYAMRLEEHAPYSAMVGVRGPDKPHPQPREYSGELGSVLLAANHDVSPRNLYLAQLRHRLKTPPAGMRKERP